MIYRIQTDLIKKRLFKNKAIIITGARQVGKTTLSKYLAETLGIPYKFINCDEPDIRSVLDKPTSTQLKQFFGKNKLIIFDEAQRINEIGIIAKIIVDEIKDVQLILTGSSAFDIGNKLNESLTGRKFEFNLPPLSISELIAASSELEEKRLLENRMIYGFYPEVVKNPGDEELRLLELVSSYLFKDIFALAQIKKHFALEKLVKALALQIGSEVSMNELAGLVGIDKNTIVNYIDLLEKAYIVFSLNSLSSNSRNELKKSRKIFFWDTGIRNSIIKNFTTIDLRTDLGGLWENFVIAERLKYLQNNGLKPNVYFWRTYQQQEIDLIEEWNGKYKAYEIKWKENKKNKYKKIFQELYPDSTMNLVNRENLFEFVQGDT